LTIREIDEPESTFPTLERSHGETFALAKLLNVQAAVDLAVNALAPECMEFEVRRSRHGGRLLRRDGLSASQVTRPRKDGYLGRWDRSGNLLALRITAANEQEGAQVAELAKKVQEVTGGTVEIAYVDQGYTGEVAVQQAEQDGIKLAAVRHSESKRGFVLSPRRWVVERTFGWLTASADSHATTSD
jgi:transposase